MLNRRQPMCDRRLGVNGVKPQTKLTPDETSANMTVENQKWSPEKDRPYIIRATGKEVTGLTWKEYSFSFTPDKDGYIWLSLEGQFPPKEDPKIVFKVDYDNVVVTGGSIENGDFETLDENGKAKFWTYAGEVIPQGSAPALLGTHFVTATRQQSGWSSIERHRRPKSDRHIITRACTLTNKLDPFA